MYIHGHVTYMSGADDGGYSWRKIGELTQDILHIHVHYIHKNSYMQHTCRSISVYMYIPGRLIRGLHMHMSIMHNIKSIIIV